MARALSRGAAAILVLGTGIPAGTSAVHAQETKATAVGNKSAAAPATPANAPMETLDRQRMDAVEARINAIFREQAYAPPYPDIVYVTPVGWDSSKTRKALADVIGLDFVDVGNGASDRPRLETRSKGLIYFERSETGGIMMFRRCNGGGMFFELPTLKTGEKWPSERLRKHEKEIDDWFAKGVRNSADQLRTLFDGVKPCPTISRREGGRGLFASIAASKRYPAKPLDALQPACGSRKMYWLSLGMEGNPGKRARDIDLSCALVRYTGAQDLQHSDLQFYYFIKYLLRWMQNNEAEAAEFLSPQRRKLRSIGSPDMMPFHKLMEAEAHPELIGALFDLGFLDARASLEAYGNRSFPVLDGRYYLERPGYEALAKKLEAMAAREESVPYTYTEAVNAVALANGPLLAKIAGTGLLKQDKIDGVPTASLLVEAMIAKKNPALAILSQAIELDAVVSGPDYKPGTLLHYLKSLQAQAEETRYPARWIAFNGRPLVADGKRYAELAQRLVSYGASQQVLNSEGRTPAEAQAFVHKGFADRRREREERARVAQELREATRRREERKREEQRRLAQARQAAESRQRRERTAAIMGALYAQRDAAIASYQRQKQQYNQQNNARYRELLLQKQRQDAARSRRTSNSNGANRSSSGSSSSSSPRSSRTTAPTKQNTTSRQASSGSSSRASSSAAASSPAAKAPTTLTYHAAISCNVAYRGAGGTLARHNFRFGPLSESFTDDGGPALGDIRASFGRAKTSLQQALRNTAGDGWAVTDVACDSTEGVGASYADKASSLIAGVTPSGTLTNRKFGGSTIRSVASLGPDDMAPNLTRLRKYVRVTRLYVDSKSWGIGRDSVGNAAALLTATATNALSDKCSSLYGGNALYNMFRFEGTKFWPATEGKRGNVHASTRISGWCEVYGHHRGYRNLPPCGGMNDPMKGPDGDVVRDSCAYFAPPRGPGESKIKAPDEESFWRSHGVKN